MTSTAAWCKACAALDECLGAGALSADDVAALAVVSRSQPLTVTELTCALALSKAKTTRLLRHLIGLDLVAERVSPRDRRRSLLRMTPRGENILFEVGHSLDSTVLDTALTGMRALREAARWFGSRCASRARSGAAAHGMPRNRDLGSGRRCAATLLRPVFRVHGGPPACRPWPARRTPRILRPPPALPGPHFAGHLSSCRSPSGMECCMGVVFMRL